MSSRRVSSQERKEQSPNVPESLSAEDSLANLHRLDTSESSKPYTCVAVGRAIDRVVYCNSTVERLGRPLHDNAQSKPAIDSVIHRFAVWLQSYHSPDYRAAG